LSRHFEPASGVFQIAKTIFGQFPRTLPPVAAIRNDYDSAQGGRQRSHGWGSGGGRFLAAWFGARRAGTGEPRRRGWNPTRYWRGLGRNKLSARCEIALSCLAVAIASLLGGCATKQLNDDTPKPGSGVAEYRQLTSEAVTAVRAALAALDKVSVASNPCPPKLVAAFASEVQRLHVDSLRIRARGQAIRARGDAYFADWSESISRIEDPQVRDRADRFHPELQQCFARLKLASQQAGAAFKPFLSGLRMLRVQLEKQPVTSEPGTTKDLLRTTRERGGEVLQQLDLINQELATMTQLLTHGKSVAIH
jgi:hypothetical protein